MAKSKTAAAGAKPKKKATKAAKAAKPTKTKSAKKLKSAKSGKASTGFDALARLAEHPIVADLIAIGATAAVTALAKGMSARSGKTSTKAVKDAGKAAAAAIGQRLVTEYHAVKDSAAEAQAKAGAKAKPRRA